MKFPGYYWAALRQRKLAVEAETKDAPQCLAAAAAAAMMMKISPEILRRG